MEKYISIYIYIKRERERERYIYPPWPPQRVRALVVEVLATARNVCKDTSSCPAGSLRLMKASGYVFCVFMRKHFASALLQGCVAVKQTRMMGDRSDEALTCEDMQIIQSQNEAPRRQTGRCTIAEVEAKSQHHSWPGTSEARQTRTASGS